MGFNVRNEFYSQQRYFLTSLKMVPLEWNVFFHLLSKRSIWLFTQYSFRLSK